MTPEGTLLRCSHRRQEVDGLDGYLSRLLTSSATGGTRSEATQVAQQMGKTLCR